MPSSISRTKGRAASYKFDRGGTPADPGPFLGRVKNNVDPTRMGRLQVYIEQFSGGDENNAELWRTVSYLPPFYGSTFVESGTTGPGTFLTNQQSYGMWFTPPDLGVTVICFFIEGDPNQGFYTGVVPDEGINHMIPAIGAQRDYALSAGEQEKLLSGSRQLPVTEINTNNLEIALDPRYFDRVKPVHSVLAAIMLQQGIIKDTVRGPITSNSQRESPSTVFGFSTPGRAIYQGGMTDLDIKQKIETDQIKLQDVSVIGRRGGHSMVLDDGDLEGKDNLIRIRTAKGHQITMSDDGDCFYIIHANGQTWVELGKQGTVDVFSTNSVNVRTQGTLNLHADRDINMYAGGSFNVKSATMKIQASSALDIMAGTDLKLYSSQNISVLSDGSLALQSTTNGTWDAGASMSLEAGCLNLNSGKKPPRIKKPRQLKDLKLTDTTYVADQGWVEKPQSLSTIVTRAPTHEPYPYHNQGTANVTALEPEVPEPLTAQTASVVESLDQAVPAGAIDAADYVNQPPASVPVGSLEPPAVTGLLAQASAVAGQAADVISDAGIGKFAMSPQALESAGLLKPGTVQTFLPSATDLASVNSILSSPTVWTGRAGATSLQSFLGDPALQDSTQQGIMVGSLTALQKTGVITGNESPADLAPFVQVATTFGVQNAVDWASGFPPADLSASISGVAKGAKYAVDFVDNRLPGVLGTGLTVGGVENTVRRAGVDSAVAGIIGDSKIPLPDFSGNLFAATPAGDLVYSGSDPIVWERVNAERLRRGLPGLAAIGQPRPAG
jgi:hypothetical protein